MQSKLLQKRSATAPVMNKPSGERISYEEAVAVLFPTDAEEEAAISQAILEDEEGKPYEQVKAEQDRELETWVEEAKRKLRNR